MLRFLTQALTCGHVHEYTVPQLHEEDTGLPLAISIKHMKMDRPFELGKLIFKVLRAKDTKMDSNGSRIGPRLQLCL